MNNVISITGILGLVIAALAGIIIPIFLWQAQKRKVEELQREKDADEKANTSVTSWESMTSLLARERDRLSEQLALADQRHASELIKVEEKWRKQLVERDARIGELENEVSALQRIIREGK